MNFPKRLELSFSDVAALPKACLSHSDHRVKDISHAHTHTHTRPRIQVKTESNIQSDNQVDPGGSEKKSTEFQVYHLGTYAGVGDGERRFRGENVRSLVTATAPFHPRVAEARQLLTDGAGLDLWFFFFVFCLF